MDKKTIETEHFGDLSYAIAGDGPHMVLIHGFPENSGLWREVWHSLASDFTVIAPDLPGTGGSDVYSGTLTMEKMAEAIKLICEAENADQVILAGHSMGGYTALAFAEKYPSSVKGLSLVHSVATADNEEKKETRRKAIALIEKGGKEQFVKQMVPNLFSEWYKTEHKDVVDVQIERALGISDESLVAFYNAMIMRPDRTNILQDAAFAVQWIVGKEDTAVSPQAMLQQSKLASVNFVSIYDDCAHMSMLEQPGKLVKDLTEFGSYCNGK